MTSRVAKNPVVIPSGVDVNLSGQSLTVKGPKGEMKRDNHALVTVTHAEGELTFVPANDSKEANALAGTSRALAANMVAGVTDGFTKKMILVGVGYRAKVQGSRLELSVGLSHPVFFDMPEGLKVESPAQTEILISGIDKQRVAQMAANIRRVRPPEPYKGKGIRYEGEEIILKEGKKK